MLRVGVGSNGIHPYPGKNTSTQAWAFRSTTVYGPPTFVGGFPVVKPTATRAGIPCSRSTSAIAPENIWQYPRWARVIKSTSGGTSFFSPGVRSYLNGAERRYRSTRNAAVNAVLASSPPDARQTSFDAPT